MFGSTRRGLGFVVAFAALSVPADLGVDGRSTLTFGRPGRDSYTRGEPFSVAETDRQLARVEISLHVVTSGTYGTWHTRSVNLDAPLIVPVVHKNEQRHQGGLS